MPINAALSMLRNKTSRPTGTIMAPPKPCNTRAAVSSITLLERPQSMEPIVNRPIAARNTVRPPNRSAAQPLTGTNTARLSK